MAEEKKPEGATEEKPVVAAVDTTKAVGDVLVEKPVEGEKETVPLATFLKEKSDLKDAKQRITDLEKLVADGGTKSEIATKLKELAKEFPEIPEAFVEKLGATLSAEVSAQAENIADKKLKPFQERENAATTAAQKAHIDTVFAELFEASIANMEDYKDIAEPDVIKRLSLLPENAKKTMPQIIEETYRRAVELTGRKPIDDTRPGGGKDPAPVDMERARRDTKYFQEIMANPELKKEYNAQAFAVKRRK